MCIAISSSLLFSHLSVPHTSHPEDEIHLKFALFNLFIFLLNRRLIPCLASKSFQFVSVNLQAATLGRNSAEKDRGRSIALDEA